jgi:hypothetical protein
MGCTITIDQLDAAETTQDQASSRERTRLMSVETQIIAVGENEEVTLKAPQGALAMRRVDKNKVEVFPLSEQALRTLVDEQERPDFAADVRQFSMDRGILPYVEKAVRTAREVFAGQERVTVSIKRDEYGEAYVDIHVLVDEGAEAEAELYSRCVEEWASFIPPQVAGAIQLSTSWARK